MPFYKRLGLNPANEAVARCVEVYWGIEVGPASEEEPSSDLATGAVSGVPAAASSSSSSIISVNGDKLRGIQ